jgi:hypothetical protein
MQLGKSRLVSRKTPGDARTLNAVWKLCSVRTLSNAKQLDDARRPGSARRLSDGRVMVKILGLRRFSLGRRRMQQLLVCGTTGICRTRVPSTRATHRSAKNLPASSLTYLARPARSAPAAARASSRTPPARFPQNKPPHTEPAAELSQPTPTHPWTVQTRKVRVQLRFRRTAAVRVSRPVMA